MKTQAVDSVAVSTTKLTPEQVEKGWFAAMRAGDFERAWQITDLAEAPRRRRGFRNEAAGELLWDGTSFRGRRVLVRCLHGLGDTLQFIRFIPEIRKVASKVYFAVQPAFLPLLSGDPAMGDVIDGWVDHWPDYDVEIEIMELAYALRITASQLPGNVPYLDLARILRSSQWKAPEVSARKRRIGLVWQAGGWDRSRSVPVEALEPLANVDAEFYSLQQEVCADDVARIPFPITNLAPTTSDPLDAAAAMLWLDLVLAVDSMPAHLAGALNRPVWVMLKNDGQADWRWMEKRETSPWYPSMRLFRRSGSWSELGRDVAAALQLEQPSNRGS